MLSPKVDKIIVAGYNRDTYIAYIGDGIRPDKEEFIQAVNQIAIEVNNDMLENDNFWEWSEERNYMAIREQAYRIARRFEWTLEGGRLDG